MRSQISSAFLSARLCLAHLTASGLWDISNKMKFFLLYRRTLVAGVLSLFVIGIGAAARASVIVTTVGIPTFVPTDFHMFAAPIGTAADNYAEFAQTPQAILPPPNHLFDANIGIVPGAPHSGPYDHEMARGWRRMVS